MKITGKTAGMSLLYFALCFTLAFVSLAEAQTEVPTASPSPAPTTALPLPSPVITDVNGDGVIEVLAFGDSITRGVGDFTPVGEEVIDALVFPVNEAGYPLRVEQWLGISVLNRGDPGERVTETALARFVRTVPQENPDFVVISGGSNDAIGRTSSIDLGRTLQTMVNIALALGIEPVLASAPPSCCDHSGSAPFIRAYNDKYRELAAINEIPLADIDQAYKNTCDESECFLLNLPEGLHPNEKGYDVSGEVVAATLLGINILASDGPTLLDQALNRPAGTALTVPNPAPPTPPAPAPAREVGDLLSF